MTKDEAIHGFWSRYGLTAYDENTVPDNAQMPYITYGVSSGALGDMILLHGSIWYRSESWRNISIKAGLIAEDVASHGHVIIPFDGGRLYLTQGVPFIQRMSDPSDDMIRRIYININAEFLSAY